MHRASDALAILAVIAATACADEASSPSKEDARAAPAVTVPASCLANPGFADARSRAENDLGPLLGESLEAARSTPLPLMAATSLLGDTTIAGKAAVRLVREGERLGNTLKEAYRFPVDFATESLLFLSYWPAESVVTLRRDGGVLHVYVARAKPCVDEDAAASLATDTQEVLVASVPTDITSAELHQSEKLYVPVLPTSADACTREGVVFTGGGRSGVLAGTPNTLFVEGFSMMTGNLFETVSADGVSWAPTGWDETHLLSFDERGPFADVYAPFPIRIGDALFLYAGVLPKSGSALVPRIGRSVQTAGVRFGPVEEVLLPAASGWDDGAVTGPSLLERDGALYMYYAGVGASSSLWRIGLAKSVDGGKTFTRARTEPVVGPDAFSYGVSSIQEPEVRLVGGHLEMWCAVALSGGNPSSRLTTAIAHLTSSDGIAWHADEAPLILPRGELEEGGLTAPAIVVSGEDVSLFATAINARHEPVVERFACRKP